MKNFDRQQFYICIAGIVLAGGFIAFRYVPIVRQNVAVTEKIKEQEALINQIHSQGTLFPELVYQREQLTERLIPFEQKVPRGRNFAQLWQQIADIMNDCKLREQLVRPGSELKSDRLCSIPLTIECKGTLEQIFTFFKSLENIDRLIQIEEMELEKDADLHTLVKLYAKANVYYQPDEKNNG